MNPSRWSIMKAALYGAVLGVPILWLRHSLLGEGMPTEPAHLVAFAAAGIFGGAFLFVVVAAIRNFFVR